MKSTNLAGRPGAERPGRLSKGTRGHQTRLVGDLLRLSGEAARSSGGFKDRWVDLGGRTVLLRFAGPATSEPLMPAFAHIETDANDEPALRVHIWDSRSSATAPPVPQWSRDAFREYGAIRGYFGDGFFAVYAWGLKALSVVDMDGRNAFFWIEDIGRLDVFHRASPLRVLLHLWLIEQSLQLVHGAALGRPDGCVLLVGNSGAGKSSTALSCLESDLLLLSDDYCLMTQDNPPTVSSLYGTAKVERTALGRLPGLEGLVAPVPGSEFDKALLDLHTNLPGKLLARAPLRAVVAPRISGERETHAVRCSGGTALRALAPSTLLQLPGNDESAMRNLGSIVRSVPCFRLDVGTEPALIAPAIEAILDG